MHIPRSLGIAVVAVISLVARQALAAEQDLIVYDNDWNVPGSYMEEDALMLLLTSPHVKVLGLTTATGDCWRDEGAASLLRYLEVIGATDIPVVNGAVFPLVNTRKRMVQWEQTYGFIYWKGAWNDPAQFPKSHPDDPYKINPPLDRMPRISPAAGIAANFLVQIVRAHPHEVTIFEGGPMTNLALAIGLDPEFAGLAKRLVFFGGAQDQLGDTSGNADGFHSDFNIIFDPEAAHIVLAAHWAKIISIADVTNAYILDKDLLRRIQAHRSPASDYLAQNSTLGLPLWGELGAAIIADPSLVTKSAEVTMDVDIDHGMSYGRTVLGPVEARPRFGMSDVTIIEAVDGKRFIDEFVKAVQTDLSATPR
jgi:inosine-uridine nucleoside N-ribohydrolase